MITEISADVDLVKSAWQQAGIYDIIQEVIVKPTVKPPAINISDFFELMTA